MALTLLVAILLALPAGAAERVTLRAMAQAPLRSLDPIADPDYVTTEHGYLVYDTLFALDAGLAVRPQMAESEKISVDGLTHVITLRRGLMWHDGTPVTPADCIASIERWARHDQFGAALLQRIGAMRAEGDSALAITLDKPFPLLARALAKPTWPVPFMMPARIARAAGDKPIGDPTGSGPFRMLRSEWNPGRLVVYERNTDYVARNEPPSLYAGGKQAHIDRFEWHHVPDDAMASFELYAGWVHFWSVPTPVTALALARNPDVALQPLDPLGQMLLLRLNHRSSPFDDARLRRAALLAVDREAILALLAPLAGDGRPCASIFPCGLPGATTSREAAPAQQRQAEVKRLMQEAGYRGQRVTLLTARDQQIVDVTTRAVATQLRQAGFAVELKEGSWSELTLRREAPQDWSGFVTRWPALDLASPGWNRALRANGNQSWFGWPDDPRLESLRERWLATAEANERRTLVDEMEEAAAQTVPYVTLGQIRPPVGVRTTLKGLVPAPAMVMWGVRLEK